MRGEQIEHIIREQINFLHMGGFKPVSIQISEELRIGFITHCFGKLRTTPIMKERLNKALEGELTHYMGVPVEYIYAQGPPNTKFKNMKLVYVFPIQVLYQRK